MNRATPRSAPRWRRVPRERGDEPCSSAIPTSILGGHAARSSAVAIRRDTRASERRSRRVNPWLKGRDKRPPAACGKGHGAKPEAAAGLATRRQAPERGARGRPPASLPKASALGCVGAPRMFPPPIAIEARSPAMTCRRFLRLLSRAPTRIAIPQVARHRAATARGSERQRKSQAAPRCKSGRAGRAGGHGAGARGLPTAEPKASPSGSTRPAPTYALPQYPNHDAACGGAGTTGTSQRPSRRLVRVPPRRPRA
jgi:hypothetical protein